MLSLDRSNGWNTSVFQILLIAWASSSWCHPSCSVFFFNLGKFSIFLFLFRTYTSIFFVMTDSKDCLTLYVPYHNQVHIQTNKMHFLYVFILQFMYNSTCFEQPFRSSSGIHDLLYLHGLYRVVQSCRWSKSWTPDDERKCCSKYVELYKNCTIHTESASCWFVCIIGKNCLF